MRGERVKRSLARFAIASSLLLLHSAGAAQQPLPATVATCNACHGPGGNSQIPLTPSLAGQPKLFVENQLVLIREGLRDVPQMKEIVAGMSDETIVALAQHYAAQAPASKPGALNAEKTRLGAATASKMLCGTCHLSDYKGQNQVPRLAGQDETYLVHSMKQFRDHPGPGRDTIMAAVLYGLTDADLANMAHYLSTFKP
ncbi:MAG TPA: c-type cytochrome [Burkholderiaceae bacterium]|nr:c-type cytochrome [Burkholderiaceae bacterium]